MNSKRHGKEPMGPPCRRGYVQWNSQMDAILTSIYWSKSTKEQGRWGFQDSSVSAVVDKLRTELSMIVTVDHVRNRIKVWKNHYAIISEIRTYAKFKWDEERKMVVIPIDDLSAWKLYYQFLKPLHIRTSASRIGMTSSDGEGLNNMKSPLMPWTPRLRGLVLPRTPLAVQTKGSRETALQMQLAIYDVISNVLGISRHQMLRAVKRFMNGMPDEFEMLKIYPRSKN
ncbi:Inter-alpha-trypsin inhibitor heavy chain H5 [Bienertia sinuspersici]